MMSRYHESPGLWVNWLAMFFCLALTSTQLQGQNRSETVATTGDAAPDGNGEFGFLSSVQLNNTGQTSFTSSGMTGTDLGSTDNVGVFRAGVGGLVQIARSNANVLSVGGSRINDSGQVAYGFVVPGGVFLDPRNGIRISDGTTTTTVALELAGAGNEVSGIAGFNNAGQIAYRLQLGFTDSIRRFNGADTTQIVQEGQAAPDGDGAFGNLALDSRRQAINESGQVAFYADITSTSSTSTNQGIFRSDGVNLTQIARKGQASPDGNGHFSDLREFDSQQPSINDHGEVAFVATLTGTSGGIVDSRGLYIGNGGSLSQILRSGQASPDGNGSFLNFVDAHLNNSGQVAFLGVMAENDGGIFHGSSGGITKIARTGDVAYDGNGFFSANYSGLAQNDSGQTAFIASTASSVGGLPDSEGLFTSDGIDSLTVVRFGDSLEGSTVAGIGDNPRRQIALNRHGQIAYRAQLADGRDTLQLWTPDLHWRTSGNGDWDTGNNWTLGLNPSEVHDVFIDPSSSAVVTGPAGDANVRNLTIGGGGGVATLVLNGSELAISPGFGNGVNVLADGVLAGSGQINGNTEVFGTLAPGESAGHLSFQGDLLLNSLSSLSIDLGGSNPSQFDRISVFDNLFLDGLLNVNLINGHTLRANESYLIADIGGTLTGQFSGLGEGDLVGNFSGVDLFISYNRGNGNDIALFTAVPEPGSLILLSATVLGFSFQRRRKQSHELAESFSSREEPGQQVNLLCNLRTNSHIRRVFALSLLAMIGFDSQASAELIPINNASFEGTLLADGSSTGTTTGWNRLGSAGVLNPTAAQFTGGLASHGENVAFLNAGGTGAILHQDLVGTNLERGRYTFQFDVGNRLDQAFPEFSFHFLINATTIIPLKSFDTPTVLDGSFQTWTFSYETTTSAFDNFIGDPTRIRFLALDNATGGSVIIDNVQGTYAPVPEPCSLFLLLLSTMMLLTRRRTAMST